jgi:smad nuclear-interacting protein 1
MNSKKSPYSRSDTKEAENYSTSGSLSKDKLMFNGVFLKYSQPPEARIPEKKGKRLYVFRGKEHLDTIDISKQSGIVVV